MGVFILTGMPGAGKEELVSVAIELGYQVRRMGDVVQGRGRQAWRGSCRRTSVSSLMRNGNAHGYDIWAKRIVPLVSEGDTLIDGCRGMSEVNVFRSAFGEHVKVVAVHSSPSTDIHAWLSRARSDAPRDRRSSSERDQRELELGPGRDHRPGGRDHSERERTWSRFRTDAFALLKELKG